MPRHPFPCHVILSHRFTRLLYYYPVTFRHVIATSSVFPALTLRSHTGLSRLVVTLGRAHQNPSIYSDPDEPDRHRSRQGGPEPSNTESTPQTYVVDKDAKLVYYGGQQVFWKTDKWLFTEVALSWQQCLAIDPEYRKQYRDISLGDELPEEPAATPEPRRTEPEQHSPVDFTTPRPAQAEIIEESEPESENTTNRTPEEDPEEFKAAPEPVGKTPQEEPIRTEPTNEPEAKMAEERTNEIKLKMPPEFSGKRGEVVEWLQKCSLYLTMNKKTYDNDEMKIVFCLMLMNGGTAGTWSRTFIEDVERQAADQNKNLRPGENRVEPNYGTWDEFKKQLLDAFDDVDQKASARVLLRNLKQGSKKVEDYIAEFKSIISRCGITEFDVIADFFYAGLNRPLREKIFGMYPLPKNTSELYLRASTLEQQYHLGRAYDGKTSTYRPTYKAYRPRPQERDPDAMDVDKMTTEEREKHYREGRCFNCHQIGHLARQCPNRRTNDRKRTKPTAKARITEVEEDESDDDEDTRSINSQAADKTQLIAARIRTALKGLEEDRDAQEILASFSNKGF
ncbi:hypothetical protein ONZ51_g426 [Trametes cubensis]|uniref:CCHC-type domain-containing protein n=1 Tax=Trametes cubensis TaxID=1111947 RepID=A0AAD7U5G3_9APHY|nr:hypothetical protein ONZ51_g426 [Trametes cubensis]